MKLEQRHSFSLEEAEARLRALARYWERRHGLRAIFKESTASVNGEVKGVKVNARVSLNSHAVVVDADDPPLLLRALAKAYVASKLSHFLDPAVPLATLVKEAGD